MSEAEVDQPTVEEAEESSAPGTPMAMPVEVAAESGDTQPVDAEVPGKRVKQKARPRKQVAKVEAPKKEAAQRQQVAKVQRKAKSPRGELNPPCYEGPPTKSLPGGWPEGWIERQYKRVSGASSGHVDSYFYPPPGHKYKLRSILEVKRYLFAIKMGSDAATAFKQRKGGPTE